MRYAGCLTAALLAGVLAAGCGESGAAGSGKRLAKKVSEARRLYRQATAVLANPPAPDVLKLTGDRRVVGRITRSDGGYAVEYPGGLTEKIPAAEVVEFQAFDGPDKAAAAAGRAGSDSALELLGEARKLLTDALAANAEAGVSAKANARQLLGDVELALGSLLYRQAEQVRSRVVELRGHATGLAASARGYVTLAEFNKSLATMTVAKVDQARQAARNDLDDLQKKIAAADGDIAQRTQQIDGLTKANAALLTEARRLRDQSERATGRESLNLLKQAHAKEGQRDKNEGLINRAKDEIDTLLTDKALLQQQAGGAQARLTVLDGRLKSIGDRQADARDGMTKAQGQAKDSFQQLLAVADRIVEVSGRVLDQQTEGLKALNAALDSFNLAAKEIEQERSAARQARPKGEHPLGEMAAELADSKHLAAVMATAASAKLTAAELRSSQLAMAAANRDLAGAIADLAETLSLSTPAAVGKLRSYIGDEAKTRQQALAHYGQAEKELKAILDGHLKDRIGRNTKWIYQAQLADTYLGHSRLLDRQEAASLLTEAQAFADEALDGKAGSPYLGPVRRLKVLIHAAKAE